MTTVTDVNAAAVISPSLSADPMSAYTTIFMTGLRDAIKLGGGFLILKGATTSSVELMSGFALILGASAWSMGVSWWKQRKLAVTHQAVQILAPANEVSVTQALNQAQVLLAAKANAAAKAV